jgi:ribosomal protein S18 acetylase RimI-like enzyme
MTELRPSTPPRRPDTVRPRGGTEPAVAPPSPAELDAMERHLAALPVHSGATLTEPAGLGAMLVTGPVPGPGFDYAGAVRWPVESWPARIARVERELRRHGHWPSVLLADELTRPPGLADELRSAGWTDVERETVLWVGHASIVPHLDPSLRLEAVTERNLAEHESLERRIFGLPPAHGAQRRAALARALATDDLRAYLVRLHGEPVAVARLSVRTGLAGLYGIGVAPAHRGHGLGTLVTVVATRAGLALGNRLVWLSVDRSNAAAVAVYTRLGFVPAFSWSRLMAPARGGERHSSGGG